MGQVIELGACCVCGTPTPPGVDHCSQVCVDEYVGQVQELVQAMRADGIDWYTCPICRWYFKPGQGEEVVCRCGHHCSPEDSDEATWVRENDPELP